ncbi:OmpA family protein [Rhodoferax sp.]|uniref:OmpA family protein n=1 Tax=Rhodoferax sp. TaxID=50421 RepID=UPI002774F34C|nr:OmpA family protein [Rhodoferax sp.]
MNYSPTQHPLSLAVSCALLLGAVAGPALAQIKPADAGYLTDQRGVVARSGYNLCWRAGSDPTPEQIQQCDPKPAPIPMAAVVEPARPAPMLIAQAAPPPAPIPTRVTRRVTFDADALFDFDKATLRPAGRTALDGFVASIKTFTPEMITATGHADRFGSDAYNQRLSERRVQTVKSYLVSQNIDANRIRAEGKGESQPVTKPGDCLGAKSAKVIACLQPDRRVEVEVVGTLTTP